MNLIKLFVLDVDGVLTDGRLYFTDRGEQGKFFHVHDGQGLKLLQSNNIEVAVISARNSKAVEIRLAELGIKHVFLGQKEKLTTLDALCNQLKLSKEAVAYMGDDLADLACMKTAGLSIAPANAVRAIKTIATWETQKSGGDGAVREACEYILSGTSRKDEMRGTSEQATGVYTPVNEDCE